MTSTAWIAGTLGPMMVGAKDRQPGRTRQGMEIGGLEKEVIIPELKQPPPAKPIDLGTLTVLIDRK